jgi:DnaJ-class molecular chaperone
MPTDSNSKICQTKSSFDICPNCHGSGEEEITYYAYASFNRDVGEQYTVLDMCEVCSGSGVVEEPPQDLD